METSVSKVARFKSRDGRRNDGVSSGNKENEEYYVVFVSNDERYECVI
jgi:hypothetical protein